MTYPSSSTHVFPYTRMLAWLWTGLSTLASLWVLWCTFGYTQELHVFPQGNDWALEWVTTGLVTAVLAVGLRLAGHVRARLVQPTLWTKLAGVPAALLGTAGLVGVLYAGWSGTDVGGIWRVGGLTFVADTVITRKTIAVVTAVAAELAVVAAAHPNWNTLAPPGWAAAYIQNLVAELTPDVVGPAHLATLLQKYTTEARIAAYTVINTAVPPSPGISWWWWGTLAVGTVLVVGAVAWGYSLQANHERLKVNYDDLRQQHYNLKADYQILRLERRTVDDFAVLVKEKFFTLEHKIDLSHAKVNSVGGDSVGPLRTLVNESYDVLCRHDDKIRAQSEKIAAHANTINEQTVRIAAQETLTTTTTQSLAQLNESLKVLVPRVEAVRQHVLRNGNAAATSGMTQYALIDKLTTRVTANETSLGRVTAQLAHLVTQGAQFLADFNLLRTEHNTVLPLENTEQGRELLTAVQQSRENAAAITELNNSLSTPSPVISTPELPPNPRG